MTSEPLTTAGNAEDPLFDPFAEGFTDDPYTQYARLRETAPVHENPFGFWVASGHDDVSALLRSGASVEMRNVTAFDAAGQDQAGQSAMPATDDVSMLHRDPPDHTRLRRLVQKAFTPRAIKALEPRIAELTDGMLDEIADAASVDLVPTLAFPLPFAVIAEMLGTPPTDHARVRDLSGTAVRALEPVNDEDVMSAIVAAQEELVGITAEMIAWKRGHPADDLLTALIHAEEDGDMLSEDELVAQVLLLYIAGHETTVNLLSGGTVALLRHPDQLAALRADPALMPGAVEELLRYDSPVQASGRVTLEPMVLGGVEIPAGAFVMALLGSANRDERRFGPDAGELRVDREDAHHHVSFGAGPHHCLGAALARLEARVVFERMLSRFPALALDGEVRWNGRINLRGPASVPVTVRP
ncbi:cytochrome P450 [Nonomuraea rubra]|uniref:Cytochrome P450 n=1 Tax=Nonomuraea rubra TaxID=46180 RepID=A0A7X0P197_9ACTN|nr:cytochrome P450 [Nonomuraea rubra]MBB6553413.1 cytochrome P450 [Nonomuraea rubra]